MPKLKGTKRFNGKTFTFREGFKRKKRAIAFAKAKRKTGIKTRITKSKSGFSIWSLIKRRGK